MTFAFISCSPILLRPNPLAIFFPRTFSFFIGSQSIQRLALNKSLFRAHVCNQCNSVISLKDHFSNQPPMDIIFCKFSTLQVNDLPRSKKYQLVKYHEQFICTNDDQEVCHEQASHMYILDLQTSLIDVIIICRPLSSLQNDYY